MDKIDVAFSEGSLVADIIRLLKRRKQVKKQGTFCWCPVCKQDLCSNNSFVSDNKEVRYICTVCDTDSRWNFDVAPCPIIKSFYIPTPYISK